MLYYHQIEAAIAELLVNLHSRYWNAGVHPGFKKENHKLSQIAMSLEIYLERGEFDGTLKSAVECLELAGYEVFTNRI